MEHTSVTRPPCRENLPKELDKAIRLQKGWEDQASFPRMDSQGGLDDPLSKGLSGAGVCWYLINLEEGLTPEEATKKAVGRKITQE